MIKKGKDALHVCLEYMADNETIICSECDYKHSPKCNYENCFKLYRDYFEKHADVTDGWDVIEGFYNWLDTKSKTDDAYKPGKPNAYEKGYKEAICDVRNALVEYCEEQGVEIEDE